MWKSDFSPEVNEARGMDVVTNEKEKNVLDL